MRILIVEDEYNLADVIASRLEREKYIVDIQTNGEDGLDAALSGMYDLILLDVMLPGINGFDILKEIRINNIDTKVIMATAKTELDDKLNGFNKGADDYITKPFHIEEVVARVNVQLRKNGSKKIDDIIEIGNLRLNLKTSSITCTDTGESIEIGCKEFQLLEYLMNNRDLVISKEQIYTKIWGIDNEIESNNLEAYLSFIRKKLKIIGANVSIKALRGLGYKLEVLDEEVKK
jgi:DNA-binding response OmpR family regulator